jgi:probable rRNA maturation factor
LRRLRPIVRSLVDQLRPDAKIDLAICLTDADEITQLNEMFVKHKGATDVITFDYSEPSLGQSQPNPLHAEIFICLDEALRQARRFRTTWQSELVRYLVHGVLHLSGFDDRAPARRRQMKRAEDRWVRQLSELVPLEKLAERH